jgi:hypothetical protein
MPPDTRSIRIHFHAFKAQEDLFNTKNMHAEARKLIQDHLDAIVAKVIEYPKEYTKDPYGRRPYYKRTRRLYKGWKTSVRKQTRGYVGAVYNTTPYATFVQGPYQVWYHRGQGWRTLEDYLMRDELHKKIRRFARKVFWDVPVR